MSQPTETCQSADLSILLSDDEQSDDFRRLQSHLQDCVDCQTRLTRLVADDHTWNEVTQSLSDGDTPFAAEERQLAALGPATHPEMLGRLGRYEVAGVIGTGGMGVVLKGFDTELNRPVAVKLLAQHLAHSGAARQRFAREARAAAAIVHEHVVAIHDIQSDAETPFMVMQYVAGESLQTRVQRHGPLDAKEILRIGLQSAAGLAAAHAQGVVHRDVKPANILLEQGVERTLLTDFGLAAGGRRCDGHPHGDCRGDSQLYVAGASQRRSGRPTLRSVQPRSRSVLRRHRATAISCRARDGRVAQDLSRAA